MGLDGGGAGGGGGAVESYGVLPEIGNLMPINPLSQSQYIIPERCHGIGNLSQLVDSSVLRVHISMI